MIGTTSTPDKLRLVQGLGADHVFDDMAQDFAAVISDLTGGRGVDVVFGSAGQSTFAGSLATVTVRGHLINFGQASGPVGHWDIDSFAAKSMTLSRPNYAHYTDTAEKLGQHVARFFGAVRAGRLRLATPTLYPLADAAQAHRDLESRRTIGPLILIP